MNLIELMLKSSYISGTAVLFQKEFLQRSTNALMNYSIDFHFSGSPFDGLMSNVDLDVNCVSFRN